MVSEPFMAWGMILGGGLSGGRGYPQRPPPGRPKPVADQNSPVLLGTFGCGSAALCYLAVIHLGLGPKWAWWPMNFSQIIQDILIFKRYLSKEWL